MRSIRDVIGAWLLRHSTRYCIQRDQLYDARCEAQGNQKLFESWEKLATKYREQSTAAIDYCSRAVKEYSGRIDELQVVIDRFKNRAAELEREKMQLLDTNSVLEVENRALEQGIVKGLAYATDADIERRVKALPLTDKDSEIARLKFMLGREQAKVTELADANVDLIGRIKAIKAKLRGEGAVVVNRNDDITKPDIRPLQPFVPFVSDRNGTRQLSIADESGVIDATQEEMAAARQLGMLPAGASLGAIGAEPGDRITKDGTYLANGITMEPEHGKS